MQNGGQKMYVRSLGCLAHLVLGKWELFKWWVVCLPLLNITSFWRHLSHVALVLAIYGLNFKVLFFFFFFSWLWLWHGSSQARGWIGAAAACLTPVPQPRQHLICAASVTYTEVCGNTRSLSHWARPGIKPISSQRQCHILNPWSHGGNSLKVFLIANDRISLWYNLDQWTSVVFCLFVDNIRLRYVMVVRESA